MSEWTSRWKYRPSHWIFYFLQYERWDSPLCSLLLSLFQVLKSTSWKLMKIFLFSKFIVSLVIVIIIVKICIILNERDTKLHDSYCQPFIFSITALIPCFNKYELHTFVLNCQQTTSCNSLRFFFLFSFFGQCRSSVELCFKLIWRYEVKYRRSFNELKRWTWKYIRIYIHTTWDELLKVA